MALNDDVESVLDLDLMGESADSRSIAYLREFCPPDGYYFANSFGKDSTVLRDLLFRSGVKFDGHHNLTTIDPPELIQFGKRNHPETVIEKPEHSFWWYIRGGKGFPMMQARWCCSLLKERGGDGRVVVIGVRAAESSRRAGYSVVQSCKKSGMQRTMVSPILHWSDCDVWNYIKRRELPYCSLYDEGWTRFGCVFCPFERKIDKARRRWPKMFSGLLRACEVAYPEKQSWHKYGSAEAVLEWWLDRDRTHVDGEEQECFVFDQFSED